MSDVPPPEHPGWYADADGAWWWWDGATWTPAAAFAPAPGAGAPVDPTALRAGGAGDADRAAERTLAVVMWVVYLVGGGFISSLVFWFTSKQKPFVRHHAAESLNLTLALLIPQVLAIALALPWYLDVIDAAVSASSEDPPAPGAGFWVGLAVLFVVSAVNAVVAIVGIVRANSGRWWVIPLPFHPVRGVVREGDQPYEVV